MKIIPSNMYNIYNTNNKHVQSSEKNMEVKKPSNIKMDTVSISKESVQEMKIRKITSDIVSEVMKEDSPDKIQALKHMIDNNEYDISSRGIADAIVDSFFNYKKEVE